MRPSSVLMIASALVGAAQFQFSAAARAVATAPRFTVEEVDTSDVEEVLLGKEDDGDGLVQENPDYVGSDGADSSDDASDDDDESDEDESEDDEDEKESGKAAVNKELSKSFQRGRALAKFVKKYKAQLLVALILFAFRRELWLVVRSVLTDGQPQGGRMMPFSMTSILKIVIIVSLLKRQLSGGGSKMSPLLIAAALFGGSPTAFIGHFLKDMVRSNPSYIPPIEQHYTFERLNEYYTKDSLAFIKALEPPRQVGRNNRTAATVLKESIFMRKLSHGSNNSTAGGSLNDTAIVLDMTNLDTMVSNVNTIRDKVSFIISYHREMTSYSQRLEGWVDAIANASNATNKTIDTSIANKVRDDFAPEMEIIIKLGSPGGSASHYGLAAQQIGRLRDEPGIKVTICVDTVAASGGYMLAVMSTPGRLYSAPFAVVGSIGVIGQQINIHNALQNYGVTPLVFRGGKDKAPLGMIGEITEEGRQKVQQMIDTTHDAFKAHVVEARPNLASSIDDVATGDVWLGRDAVEVGLVDRLITSDAYIGERLAAGARILKLIKYDKRIHLPSIFGPSHGGSLFQNVRASIKGLREFTEDARRVVSKAANILDELPEQNADISTVAAARAFGVNKVSTKMPSVSTY